MPVWDAHKAIPDSFAGVARTRPSIVGRMER